MAKRSGPEVEGEPKSKRPARSEEEFERMKAANTRRKERHVPVTVNMISDGNEKTSLEAPHDDGAGWLIRLGDAVGSRSDEFALAQLRNLVHMLPVSETAPHINLNSMLAQADTVRPENEAEGALAVQMAATHHLAMKCLSVASCATTAQTREANGNLATKMLRTYTTQLETLAKLRRGGSQKVTVEHVHVYEGGQAIVGNVAPGGGGQLGKGPQAHALSGPAAIAFQADPTMLRSDAGREPVPVARSEGQGPMPNARRRQGKRCSEG